MSFRIFIYYCALCGGWAAFLGWAIGLYLSPSSPLGNVGIRGMWLGMFVAFGLGLVDALWNLSLRRFIVITLRVGTAIVVGAAGGWAGGIAGQWLRDRAHGPVLREVVLIQRSHRLALKNADDVFVFHLVPLASLRLITRLAGQQFFHGFTHSAAGTKCHYLNL